MDTISSEKRSWVMSRIRSKNTKPERLLRSLLHGLGYRFRLNGKVSKRLHPKRVLPGKPDVVLAKYKTVIFVHGCFWHHHQGCKGATTPKTRTDWWLAKFARNVERDKQNENALQALGWKVLTIWECELKNTEATMKWLMVELPQSIYPQTSEDLPMAAEEQAEYDQ